MAFVFALESILRLRQSQQRQQELLVQKAHEEANRAVRELQAIAAEFVEISSGSQAAVGSPAAELQFNQTRCRVLEERRVIAGDRVAKLRELEAALAQELRKIWQKREILETLRREQLRTYVLEQNRCEQRIQDDLFLRQRRVRQTRDGQTLPS